MSKQIRQNCISCALGPLFKYGAIIALPSVIITCNHKKSILRANIRSPKVFLCSASLVAILIICCLISCGLNIISDVENSKSIVEVLLRVPIFSIYLGSILVVFNGLLQRNKIRLVYELIQDSLEVFRESKIVVLLTIKDITHFRVYYYLPLFLWLSTTTALFVPIFFHIEKTHSNILEGIGILVCIYIDVVVTSFIYFLYNFICFLSKSCQHQLMGHLRNHLNLNKHLAIVNNKFVKLNTSESIAPYIRFNSQLVIASRLFNKCLNPALLTTVVIFIFVQAAIYLQYILRVVKNQPIVLDWSLFILHIEMIVSIFCCVYFIVIISKLDAMNNNMVSFLSKYPMNSLSKEEALQLEYYQRKLKRQEIVINGCDILVCKLPIFASVLSGILTFISIAMQFILLEM